MDRKGPHAEESLQASGSAASASSCLGPHSASDRPEALRLGLLDAMSEGLSDAELLRLALQHAVASLGGLGGLAHLRGPSGRGLHLVSVNGLVTAFAQQWENLTQDAPAAAALSAHGNRFVWQPLGEGEAAHSPIPSITGMASVPLPGPDAPLGVLSVLTMSSGPPGPEQCAFLTAVARWTAEHLELSSAPRPLDLTWGEQEPSESRVQQALKATKAGSWEWEIRTGEVNWGEAGLTVVGIGPDRPPRRIESWMSVVHPEDLPRVLAETEEVIRSHSLYDVEYRVRRPDGTYGWVQARGRVVLDRGGEPVRMVGTVRDTTQTRATQDSVGRALRYMSDGFFALDADWRITFVNVEAERLLGASRKALGRVLWDVVPGSVLPRLETRFRRAAGEGTPTGFDLRWPTDERWYHMRLVPMPDGLMVYAADITEQRMRREERVTAERAAAEQADRIKELTSALAKAVTSQEVVSATADRVLPLFGAYALNVLVPEGRRLRVAGTVGYPQEALDLIDNVPLTGRYPVPEVISTQNPLFIGSVDEFLARYPSLAELLSLIRDQAWAFLPLIASGRLVGVCVIAFDRPHRFTDEEKVLLTAVSGLLSQAIERARLYDTEHTRAQELQRGLLPRVLPCVPGVATAARYLPATEGLEVGGDWYDVIPLSSDRVALVIGDVMGHGLAEAATMGRLRTAVHTLADLDLDPAELLTHLNDLVSGLGDDFYVTCLYAVYDPTSGICAFARAGHPPPAMVHPDGSVRFLDSAPDPPLGAATPPFETVETCLPDGSLLVLYTDGLIESAGRDIDRGAVRLADALATACNSPRRGTDELDRLCDTLTETLVPEQQHTDDDTALLIARTRTLASENIASWPLSEDPTAARQARGLAREQLAAWGLEDLSMTTELLVSELMGNVVRHAKGPVQLRMLRSRTLILEVSDGSLTTPRIRRASFTDEGGRGLQLVAALSQRWGARYTPTGKCIWTEQALPTDCQQ
ncbi:SpoIIE family protein phosphatase [Streptomyces sp. NPDC054950]